MSTSSKSKDSDKKISVGYISSAHGVRGEVRVVPLTDYPERFRQMDSLNLYSNGLFVCTLPIKHVRNHEGKGEFIIESDLTDRTEAEKLVGLSILIDPEERISLPEEKFWVDDLIGLQVRDTQGNVLGVVEDLFSSGANETYEIRDANGVLHYIPAVEQFVKDIDLSSGKITVELIEGLWE